MLFSNGENNLRRGIHSLSFMHLLVDAATVTKCDERRDPRAWMFRQAQRNKRFGGGVLEHADGLERMRVKIFVWFSGVGEVFCSLVVQSYISMFIKERCLFFLTHFGGGFVLGKVSPIDHSRWGL